MSRAFNRALVNPDLILGNAAGANRSAKQLRIPLRSSTSPWSRSIGPGPGPPRLPWQQPPGWTRDHKLAGRVGFPQACGPAVFMMRLLGRCGTRRVRQPAARSRAWMVAD